MKQLECIPIKCNFMYKKQAELRSVCNRTIPHPKAVLTLRRTASSATGMKLHTKENLLKLQTT